MRLFGELDVRIDPWQVDYGSELPIDSADERDEHPVALDVEVAAGDWQPIVPGDVSEPRKLLFVDGVRRIDVRLLVGLSEAPCHGAFASYAVGAVAVAGGAAAFVEESVDRVVVLGAGRALPKVVVVRPALTYRPVSTDATESDAPVQALQSEMRAAEGRMVAQLVRAGDALIIADGPLSLDTTAVSAVGFIKRISTLYLPPSHMPILARLPAGARTPVFVIRSTHRFTRYSWFARLAAPARADSPYAGVVRLETSDGIGVDAARAIADTTATYLPRLVPSRGRDPRSPQNLLPIGALESRLRHRLGDARLVRRHIEGLIAEEARRAGAF